MLAIRQGKPENINTLVASMSKNEKRIWDEVLEAYKYGRAAWERYAASMGEVEARNAGLRFDVDANKRREIPPFATETYPQSKQHRSYQDIYRQSTNNNGYTFYGVDVGGRQKCLE